MSLSLKVRCTTCNERFQPAPGVCPVCAANTWEPCIVEDAPQDVADLYLHPSGVAFFAYDEAAKAGVTAPAWAVPALPAVSAATRREQLETRLTQAIAANATYLGLSSPSNAQNAAQVKSLTRQVNAMLRLQRGALDTVD